MADNFTVEGMESILNASLERQSDLRKEHAHRENVRLLGQHMETLMVSLTADIESVTVEVEESQHTLRVYASFVNKIHNTKMALAKVYAQWLSLSGAKADSAVGKTVADLEVTSTKLIEKVRAKMATAQPEVSPTPVSRHPDVPLRTGNNSKMNGGAIAAGAVESTPSKPTQASPKIPPKNSKKKSDISTGAVEATPLKPTQTNPKIHQKDSKRESLEQVIITEPQATAHPNLTPKINVSIANPATPGPTSYASQLAAFPAGRRSSRVSKYSGTSSEVKKQLLIEEAEAKVDEKFDKEQSERERRIANREKKKQEEELKKAKIRQEEEMKARAEALRIDTEQREEQLRNQEAAREAATRKKLAKVQAKLKVIESFEEERRSSYFESETEVNPAQKVTAYINNLPKGASQEPVMSVSDYQPPQRIRSTVSNSRVPNGDHPVVKPRSYRTKTISHKNSKNYELNAPVSVENPKSSNRVEFQSNSIDNRYSRTPPIYTTPVPDPYYTWSSQPSRILADPPTPRTRKPPALSGTERLRLSTPQRNENLYISPIAPIQPDSIQAPPAAEISHTERVLETVCEQIALTRLPIIDPGVFDGKDPLAFPVWRTSFETLINRRALSAVDKLSLLNRYLGGEAKAAIQGYLTMPPSEAYDEAYIVLLDRYGDEFKISGAFRDRLRTWPKINTSDIRGFRNYVDFLKQCGTAKRSFSSLRVLDDEAENIDMCKKLPAWLARQWARKVSAHRDATGDYPSFLHFVDFLSQEDRIAHDPVSRALQKAEGVKDRGRGTSFFAEQRISPPAAGGQVSFGAGRSFGKCLFCGDKHSIQVCKSFKEETIESRQRFVQENRLCFSCLVKGHIARDCRDKKICLICQGGHPTSMHRESSQPEVESPPVSVTACASSKPEHTPRKSSMIVPVFISHVDEPEKEQMIYGMIDNQSDSCFVTSSTARKLGLKGRETRLSLSTMTSNDKIVNCECFNGLQLRGINRDQRVLLPQVYSRKSIPVNRQHIPSPDMIDGWPYLEPLRNNLVPVMNCEVGILIGYNCSTAQVPIRVISEGKTTGGPFGQETVLGWGIVGVISQTDNDSADRIGYSHRIIANQVTGSQIVLQKRTKEVVSPADCLKVLEQDFSDRTHKGEESSFDEREFLRTMESEITVDASGHYSMPLPFNKKKEKLFNNKALVLNRAMSLKKKFVKNPSYRQEYTQFMQETIEKGFAEEVTDATDPGGVWYIPHFGVFHKTKGKIRVVFDCAARYQGIALNDTLLKGPDFLNSLIGILCRFRKHPIAFTCDVEKMYYAFRVHTEHRNYLRFLWWRDGDVTQPLTTYRMTAHLFGAVSSPACASFGLRRVANEFPEYGGDVLDFVTNDFYVDDGLKSVPDEDIAVSLVKRTVEVCKLRGVRLHKFSSNSEKLLKSLPLTECTAESNLLNLDLDEYPTERVLGILWNIKTDSFQFVVKRDRTPKSRREILSVTSGIFDPLGWVSPFTVRARLILQQICKNKLDWDDKVPTPKLDEWESWYEETELLSHLSIPRCLQPGRHEGNREMQLHHFSDASETAYGACSYLRSVDSEGEVSVQLIMAKSRVAPLASITIPRLELMAAVVATRLAIILEKELKYDNIQHFYWTDSTIVLGYLQNESKRFKIFVANRIQQIHDVSSPSQWRHISGLNNPADLASRGIRAKGLIDSKLWFHGPSFLSQRILTISGTETLKIDSGDQELRKVICGAVSSEGNLDVFNFSLFSSWESLNRGVARAKVMAKRLKDQRSIKARLRSNEKSPLSPLSVSDIQFAEQLVVSAVQRSYYSEEISCIESGEVISKSSSLSRLDCFLDKAGILRVGGRLRYTNLYSAFKHPIILPKGAYISTLLVRSCHQSVHHQGRGMTINEVRARGYWVISLNGLVKELIRNCVTCRVIRGKMVTQKMADLPPDRADCMPPFTYCGMDCFGPFIVKERRSELKRYGVIFTCLTTRAVHLEMAYSLSTDAFIQALRKFISIRGPIQLLRCDNGTNFVGANRELANSINCIRSPELKNFALRNGCELKFRMNPPSASHMGGAWERLIGVVRSVLNSILDQHSARLDDGAFSTFLYEVAAIINSRPLSLEHITDPHHPEPLTPNHLLTGKSRVIVPPPGDFGQDDAYSIRRWRCVQALTNHFWQRWRKEYLQYLQLRSKWQRAEREMRVGDVVLLSDAGAFRGDWKKAIVTETIVSQDGFVRSVKLKTGMKEDGTDTTLVRPVHKLVLILPSDDILKASK